MLGVRGINFDVPALNGELYAIRTILIGAGLTTFDEFMATAAEGRARFLGELIGQAQAAKRASSAQLVSS